MESAVILALSLAEYVPDLGKNGKVEEYFRESTAEYLSEVLHFV